MIVLDAARQLFQPHYDGAFPRTHEEMSHLTFIIYLNDGTQNISSLQSTLGHATNMTRC